MIWGLVGAALLIGLGLGWGLSESVDVAPGLLNNLKAMRRLDSYRCSSCGSILAWPIGWALPAKCTCGREIREVDIVGNGKECLR